MTLLALRLLLTSTFERALAAFDLQTATASLTQDITRPTLVIASGKAAPAMAEGALRALGNKLHRGLVVTTDGTPCPTFEAPVIVRRASHPVPDQRSVQAAEQAIELAAASGPNDTLLVLVSGGTSSLLCAPSIGLTLNDKRDISSALMGAGATIQELNIVRRHLSRIKGGGLLRHAKGQVIVGIVSDVVGGAAHDVGSGPASVDPTTMEEATTVVRHYLPAPLASRWERHFSETASPGDAALAQAHTHFLLRPEDLGLRMTNLLLHEGFRARMEIHVAIEASALAAMLARLSWELGSFEAVVVTAEPSISLVPQPGRGGRAGWVALRCLSTLAPDSCVLCGASDGTDGSSGSAGACVSFDLASRVDPIELESALAQRDDARVHSRLGTQLRGGPTGLNLSDIYVVART